MLKSIFGSIILIDSSFRKLEGLSRSHDAIRVPARTALSLTFFVAAFKIIIFIIRNQ